MARNREKGGGQGEYQPDRRYFQEADRAVEQVFGGLRRPGYRITAVTWEADHYRYDAIETRYQLPRPQRLLGFIPTQTILTETVSEVRLRRVNRDPIDRITERVYRYFDGNLQVLQGQRSLYPELDNDVGYIRSQLAGEQQAFDLGTLPLSQAECNDYLTDLGTFEPGNVRGQVGYDGYF